MSGRDATACHTTVNMTADRLLHGNGTLSAMQIDTGPDAITSTIDYSNIPQISGLQVRLYGAAGNPMLPVLGTPNGTTLIDAWSSPITSGTTTGTVSVLPETTLAAGTYVLEVRGTVSGSAGGSYSGVLSLTPVPLPAALPPLLSGLGGLGVMVRRRRVRAA